MTFQRPLTFQLIDLDADNATAEAVTKAAGGWLSSRGQKSPEVDVKMTSDLDSDDEG